MFGRFRVPALLLIALSPPVAAAELTFLMGADATVDRPDPELHGDNPEDLYDLISPLW